MNELHPDGYYTSMVIMIIIYAVLFYIPIAICIYAIKKQRDKD